MVEIKRLRVARVVAVALALAATGVLALPTPAHAAGQAMCIVQFRAGITPPFSLTVPNTSTANTGGENGTAQCVGTVNGAETTGPGTAGFAGVLFGTCFGGGATGTMSLTIPTKNGPQTVAVQVTGQHLGGLGQTKPGAFQATMLVGPTRGDCTTVLASEMGFTLIGTLNT